MMLPRVLSQRLPATRAVWLRSYTVAPSSTQTGKPSQDAHKDNVLYNREVEYTLEHHAEEQKRGMATDHHQSEASYRSLSDEDGVHHVSSSGDTFSPTFNTVFDE